MDFDNELEKWRETSEEIRMITGENPPQKSRLSVKQIIFLIAFPISVMFFVGLLG